MLAKKTEQPENVEMQTQKEQFLSWRVKQTVQVGEEITSERLLPVIIDQIEAQKYGVTSKERFTLVKGSLAASPMKAGSIVTENQVVQPDHPNYIDLLIKPGMIPYPLEFKGSNGYPLILSPGDKVDVVMISSLNQNLAMKDAVDQFEGLSVAPLLKARKVLRVGPDGKGMTGEEASTIIVLELTRKELSQLMLAKRMGVLDIHKTTDGTLPQIRAGDVLPDFSSVTELRGIEKIVN
ncbi:Flp pilus assembly protein CpaB [Sansalvadorimonas sp. 2012CJ34-2]|uniref:Flp pilus assembly protein CpaB n=1 Tax=Parendozoicomonas callyspongiae TaxID=2942213 RepID=A0ABT0PDA5_9GAMM|nr:Flp pilus assembly protein CpaB [Sansalvadorimonas sp. 2012CJ34-2]